MFGKLVALVEGEERAHDCNCKTSSTVRLAVSWLIASKHLLLLAISTTSLCTPLMRNLRVLDRAHRWDDLGPKVEVEEDGKLNYNFIINGSSFSMHIYFTWAHRQVLYVACLKKRCATWGISIFILCLQSSPYVPTLRWVGHGNQLTSNHSMFVGWGTRTNTPTESFIHRPD